MFENVRAAIAENLSLAEGVQGYPTPPRVISVGDAWPVASEYIRGPGFSFSAEFRVIVVTGKTDLDAMRMNDVYLERICEVLDGIIYVQSAVPVEIPFDGGSLPGLELRGVA